MRMHSFSRRRIPATAALLLICVLLSWGCTRGEAPDEDPQDHIDNEDGEGPRVLFEPNADPIPQIPFPNDILCRKDHRTFTGLRVDAPTDAPTQMERDMRERINRMDGFGTFAPITVSFTRELDLETITAETVLLINIEQDSPFYGEFVDLDIGTGSYPVNLKDPFQLFPVDPFADQDNQIFAPSNRVRHYEDETDTLILKPLAPLRQQCQYAVILTRGLRDPLDNPVQAPDDFQYAYFPNQFEDLKRAFGMLRDRGIDPDEKLAFAWVFTTQSITADLKTARDGIKHGEGPLGELAWDFAPCIKTMDNLSLEIDGDGNPITFQADYLYDVVDWLYRYIPLLPDLGYPFEPWADQSNISFYAAGTFDSPCFICNEDGIFQMDSFTGEATYGIEEVPFLLAVPKPTEQNGFAEPPYPVVIFQHGNERNRLDMVLLANVFAKHGFATFGIDAAGHGPENVVAYAIHYLDEGTSGRQDAPIAQATASIIRLFLSTFYPGIETEGKAPRELFEILMDQTILGALAKGRAEDTDGDGITDSGDNFFTAVVFRTRDILRQTVIDQMQFVRIINSLGTDWNGNGVLDLEEGDFDGDGQLDAGGEGLPVYYSGTSMGGILGSIFMAVEPDVKVGCLNVPGGGLTDLVTRSTLVSVATRVFLEIYGPRISGVPTGNGDEARLVINKDKFGSEFRTVHYPPKSKIYLNNRENGETATTTADEQGLFTLGVPSDIGDEWHLEIVDPDGRQLYDMVFPCPVRGLNLERNTPDLRNFIDIAQAAIDAGDPVNYAPHIIMDPIAGNEPKNLLVTLNIQDWTVPAATGVSVGRAAGLVSLERNARLAELGIMTGLTDVDYETANDPVESTSLHGFRLHPGGNHAYLYWPSFWEPDKMLYSFAVREQMAIFFETDGQVIEDDLDVLLEGYDLP